MAAKKPHKLTIRSYQVGFGDCFLLSFAYASSERHVLIDFGTTGQPKDATGLMRRVAQDIHQRCGGKLHAVVATHRHRDHISGFDPGKNKKGPGAIIASCKPDVVVQPWTEDPNAKTDARKPTATLQGKQAFARRLVDMQATSRAILAELRRYQRYRMVPAAQLNELAFIGEQNLENLAAVKNLQTMARRHAYVHHGSKSGLDAILPGVTISVMGPPTLEQSDTIQTQRSKDEDEFWHLQARAGALVEGGSPPAWKQVAKAPPHARWLRNRLLSERVQTALELVRILDDVLNNTSVILLFEVGGKSFLFPGDAQIENWSYALSRPADRKRLARATVYKVGHHGSLNATPKTLWNTFDHRGAAGKKGRLVTFMSTMAGKHGSEQSKTEVPRRTLVTALRKDSDLLNTQDLGTGALFNERAFDL